jgi:outer membrane receptor protein involved in Fe transport
MLCYGLHAQAESSANAEIKALLQLTFEDLLDVEVIVASKSAETVAEAPSSVTVFTRQEIQNMGVTTLGELLDFVPGFQTFRLALNGDSQGFQVRGNPMLPVFTRDVLVLLDGRRLNGSHSGGAVLYNTYLSLDNVKQVEVIRGPGSALYGSNAFLGVINIITLDDHNALTLRAGNHASKEALLHVSEHQNDWHLAGFARVYGDNGEHFSPLSDRTGRHGAANDARQAADANLKLTKGDLNLHLRHTHRRIEDFLDSEYIGANGINQSENEQSSIAFNYTYDVNNDLRFEFSGGYTRSRLYFLSDAGVQENGLTDLFGLYLENEALNIDIAADWLINSNNHWQAGFTYENTGNTDNALINNHTFDSKLHYLRGADSFTNNQDRDIFGLYIQHRHRLHTHLNMILGLRYDHYSDFGNTLNPRGALIYTTPWQDQIKLMYGRAFRAPNLADLTLNVANSKGNPNLQPEQISTIELAYVHTADYGQGIMTLFNNHIRDVITIEPDETGQFFARNEGELKRSGIELEAQLEPFADWMLRATYTHIFNNAERHAPQDFASLILNRQWQHWNMNVSMTYQGKINSLPQPQHTWLANASLRYQLMPQTTLQATIHNLTDEIYYDPSEFTAVNNGRLRGVEPGIPNRGRTFWLGVNVSWN